MIERTATWFSVTTQQTWKVSGVIMNEKSQFVSDTILQTEGLVKSYGNKTVVNGVSFKVRKGEVVGLLGSNGAGKTTSFRMTCGLIPADQGHVWLNGIEVTDWPMYRRAREGRMGYLPQERSTFNSLTVEQNLYVITQLIGMDRVTQRQRVTKMLEKFNLVEKAKQIVGNGSTGGLSGGERRRLEIARAMLTDPTIIMLDEPFANVDPKTVYGFQEVIMGLVHEGISILITDHQINETLTITDRSYVIDKGKVLCAGTPLEVLSNPDARKKYFGDNSTPPEQLMATLESRRKKLYSNPSQNNDSTSQESKGTTSQSPISIRLDSSDSSRMATGNSEPGFVVENENMSDDVEFVAGNHRIDKSERDRRTLRRDRRRSVLDDFVDDADDLPTKGRRSLGLKRDE